MFAFPRTSSYTSEWLFQRVQIIQILQNIFTLPLFEVFLYTHIWTLCIFYAAIDSDPNQNIGFFRFLFSLGNVGKCLENGVCGLLLKKSGKFWKRFALSMFDTERSEIGKMKMKKNAHLFNPNIIFVCRALWSHLRLCIFFFQQHKKLNLFEGCVHEHGKFIIKTFSGEFSHNFYFLI